MSRYNLMVDSSNPFAKYRVDSQSNTNVVESPNPFAKYRVDSQPVSNIPQIKDFPQSFLESAYEDVKEVGSDVGDFFKDIYSSTMSSYEKAEEARRKAEEGAGRIFGGATVELVTALPELISNVTKVISPEMAKEIGESPIGQAYSKVLDTINPELNILMCF